MKVLMQAVSSTNGQKYLWEANDFDAGAGFPGPGSPQHVVVLAGLTKAQASAIMPSITQNYVYQRKADGTGVEGRPMPVYEYQVPPTLDPADIQVALDALPVTGGNVYIPPGVWNLTTNLKCYGKSNVHIYGAGKRRTVLNWTGCDPLSNVNSSGWAGALSFSSNTPNVNTQGIEVSGLTLKCTRAATEPAGAAANGFALALDNVDDYRIHDVEFDGSTDCMVFVTSNGDFSHFIANGRIHHCDFRNNAQQANPVGCVATVTPCLRGLKLYDNHFDTVYFGAQLLGDGVEVHHNTFYRVRKIGLYVGESNYNDLPSLTGSIIGPNTFVQFGYGAIGTDATGYGIQLVTRSNLYADGRQDKGNALVRNVFTDTVATGSGLVLIRVIGPAAVEDNYASGIISGDGTAVFLRVEKSDADDESERHVYLSRNRLERTKSAAHVWTVGIDVHKIANLSVHLSGNRIDMGGGAGGYALRTAAPGTGNPFFTLAGDILNGKIDIGQGVFNADNTVDGEIRMYGDSDSGVCTQCSDNPMFYDIGGSATPNVKGRKDVWVTNPTPTTITDLLGGIEGQTITLMMGDGNTTINDSAPFKLNGAFTGMSSYASIVLRRSYSSWVEISRSNPG